MSPIIGLTDRTPSFKELGRLRLGIPKAEALRTGPKEIGYFRPDFRPDAMDAAALFTQAYGPTPTEIHIRLPFAEINRCWDAFYMCYNKSGLLAMADGEKWLYLRDNHTSALLVKDGLPYMAFDKTIPVYSYRNQKGVDVAVYAKPEGRLKVLIPELKRAAFVTVLTHSIYNVIKLSEQLAGVEVIAKSAGMTLPMIPMVLSRRKEMISVSINGQKAMQEKYLLNLEIDPAWMEAQFRFLDTLLPGATMFQLNGFASLALPSGQLPTPAEIDESDNGEEEIESDEFDEIKYHSENEPEQAQLPLDPDPSPIPAALAHLAGICNDEGIPYPLIPSERLSYMTGSLNKKLKDNGLTPEQKAEAQRKLDAAVEVMKYNAAHPGGQV